MSDALYERYKDALQRGHVAAAKGRHDTALEAYGEAARIAPDRALPLVSIGTVLRTIGKDPEALTAFDAALDRTATDEAALRGRAEALVALGRPADAGETLDRLAAVLENAGQLAQAMDAASEALELAESRGRRRGVADQLDRLARADQMDAAVVEASSRATRLLAADPEAPVLPPFDPVSATANVDQAVEGDDAERTRSIALEAATGHRAAGHPNAAIDACYLALASNPADPGLHLALAELYLDRGLRTTAAEKLALLARLAGLTDDAVTRTAVCTIASQRLPDDARLAGICG